MAHRAYKSIHEPMAVPDGFTLEPTEGNPAYIAPEEPSDYTTVHRTRLFHYILENKLQLSGEAIILAPGQAGYSDQRMREVDSAVILSQHNGYKMMHSKQIQKENN